MFLFFILLIYFLVPSAANRFRHLSPPYQVCCHNHKLPCSTLASADARFHNEHTMIAVILSHPADCLRSRLAVACRMYIHHSKPSLYTKEVAVHSALQHASSSPPILVKMGSATCHHTESRCHISCNTTSYCHQNHQCHRHYKSIHPPREVE